MKECKFEAITVENNVAYIDFNKCRLCKKCVEACPTKAITALNFPAPKPKPAVVEEKPAAEPKPASEPKPMAEQEKPVEQKDEKVTERKEEQA